MANKWNSLKNRILLIEDDIPLAFVIRKKLEQVKYVVDVVDNGKAGLNRILTNKYGLALVDIGLPELSGLDITRRVRNHELKTPMIIITNQLAPEVEREVFLSGGNIFHKKPVDFELLLVQIKSLLAFNTVKPVLNIGDLVIDTKKRYVSKAGESVKLSHKEFELLKLLASSPGDVFSRYDIINHTFRGVRDQQLGSIDTLVSRARKKLGDYKGSSVIETVHGSGFRLNVNYMDN